MRLMSLAGLSAMLMLAAGCSDGESVGGSGERNGASAMPPIYVESDVEFLAGGRNSVLATYEEMLRICKEAGLPLDVLSDDEVARIGRGRMQRWFREDAVAFRWEGWNYASRGETQDSLCRFALVTQRGYHHFSTPDRHEGVNLITGESIVEPPWRRDFFERAPLSPEEAGERAGLTEGEVGGQACMRIVSDLPRNEACVWSGGRKWGFNMRTPLFQPDNLPHLNRTIVLEQEPPTGNGMRVTTRRFEIGRPFDESEMTP